VLFAGGIIGRHIWLVRHRYNYSFGASVRMCLRRGGEVRPSAGGMGSLY
jgi:hypothetical protein